MQKVKKRGGPFDPTTPGPKGQALAFVSPTSALVTGRRDCYLFMIVAFAEVEILCFVFQIMHKSMVPSGYTSTQNALLKSYQVAQ